MAQKPLTDAEATQEAQREYRERAEKELTNFIARVHQSEKGFTAKDLLKNVRDLFEYSDLGPNRFLEVSRELGSLAQYAEENLPKPSYLAKLEEECMTEAKKEAELWRGHGVYQECLAKAIERAKKRMEERREDAKSTAQELAGEIREASEVFLRMTAKPAIVAIVRVR